MTVKIARGDLERLTGSTEEDPIVFECSGSRSSDDWGRLEFTHRVLLRSQRDALVAHFGQAWLDSYLKTAVEEARSFEAGCEGRTQ